MEYLTITTLNDYLFCPASIYFHNLYYDKEISSFYGIDQYNGLAAHSTIDKKNYSTRNDILCGIEVFSNKYQLTGKIDLLFLKEHKLVERKKKVKRVYDGFVFQLYGQYFGLKESGYEIERMVIHSLEDNKNYEVGLPDQNPKMLYEFNNLIDSINSFDISSFVTQNSTKCKKCIYCFVCTCTDYDE